MKNSKIVKRIASLVLVGTIAVSVLSCSKKNKDEEVLSDAEIFNEAIQEVEGEETQKKVGKVVVYKPVDFTTVTNVEEKYNEVYEIRQEYLQKMENVLEVRVLFSDEEVAAAVYNVIKADSDLASLMNKICEQKRESVKKDYVDIQLEKLTALKQEMADLQQTLNDAENIWSKHIDDIADTEIDKIIKVKKYNNLALEQSIKRLEKDIEKLEIELEAMNSKNV